MIKCISGKKVYASAELAEDALIEARTSFDYGAHRGPIAVYQCEDCGYYHLTSRGPMNPRLTEYMASGKLKRQKEARDWENKLKKK